MSSAKKLAIAALTDAIILELQESLSPEKAAELAAYEIRSMDTIVSVRVYNHFERMSEARIAA